MVDCDLWLIVVDWFHKTLIDITKQNQNKTKHCLTSQNTATYCSSVMRSTAKTFYHRPIAHWIYSKTISILVVLLICILHLYLNIYKFGFINSENGILNLHLIYLEEIFHKLFRLIFPASLSNRQCYLNGVQDKTPPPGPKSRK